MKKTVNSAKRTRRTSRHKSLSAAPASSLDSQLQPSKEPVSYWRKHRYYIVALVIALGVFGLCAWMVRRQIWLGREITLFGKINDWPDKIRPAFAVITMFGSFWTAAVVVTGAFVLKLYQLTWRLALSICTASGLLIVLKEFFARVRPELFISDLQVRAVETSFAFPSAHAALATVLALTLRTYIPLPTLWQWLIVLSWIGGVSLSRMYLGVHAPLDVAAGIALGVGTVCFWRVLPMSMKRILRLK